MAKEVCCRVRLPLLLGAFGVLLSMGSSAGGGEARVVSRVEPEFPREALQSGAQKGRVRARITVSAAGEVMRVEIVEAEPRRVFDRAVVKTLALWRFDSGADGRSVEIDVDFHR